MNAEIFSFHSIKMGVGRSMAVASIGLLLANKGKRVLIVDWDLDNPTLHKFFNGAGLDSSPGVIDLCWELMLLARGAARSHSLEVNRNSIASILPTYIRSVDNAFNSNGKLDIMRAAEPGRRSRTRIRYFPWSEFYDQLKGAQIMNVVFETMREAYDYVLVDAPAGSSFQFPIEYTDRLILCLTLDEDSIHATAELAAFMQNRSANALRLYPMPMRVDVTAEMELQDRQRSMVREYFAPYVHHLLQNGERYWQEVMVAEIRFFAFQRELPPARESASNPDSITISYERLIRYLTDSSETRAVPLEEASPKPDRNRIPADVEIDFRTYSGPCEGDEDYCFVSYSRSDVDMVMPLVQDVFDLGYRLWWDAGIPGGAEWMRHLEEKIRQCRYVLLFLSRHAVTSNHIKTEIEYAQQNQKTVLVVRLDLTPLPQSFEDILGKYQMLNVSDVRFEERFGKTLRLVNA